MGTFETLIYSIQFQLKMKREITNAFCCLSFTIAQGPLKSATVHDQTCLCCSDSGGGNSKRLMNSVS